MTPNVSHTALSEESKIRKQEEIKRKFNITHDTVYEVRRNIKKD